MARLLIPCFCLCFKTAVASDVFFGDISQKSDKTYEEQKKQVKQISLESPDEEQFYQRMQKSVARTSRIKLSEIRSKIDMLDRAVTLPGPLQKKYVEQQKELLNYQKELASRYVDNILAQQPPKDDDSVATDSRTYMAFQARKLAKKLPVAERQEFIGNWKASMVDSKARELFVPYLSMASLYGYNDSLVQKINKSMRPSREQFKKQRAQSGSSFPKNEESDFVYRMLAGHERRMSFPVQQGLKRIAKYEKQIAGGALSKVELKLALQKMGWEKQSLLRNLKRDGLELFEETSSGLSLQSQAGLETTSVPVVRSLEEKFLLWFRKQQEKPQSLLWPLLEKGEVVKNFEDEDSRDIVLQTLQHHIFRACGSGRVTMPSKGLLVLQLKGLTLNFEADFEPLVKDGEAVLKGRQLGVLTTPHLLRITAFSVSDKTEQIDFLSFF